MKAENGAANNPAPESHILFHGVPYQQFDKQTGLVLVLSALEMSAFGRFQTPDTPKHRIEKRLLPAPRRPHALLHCMRQLTTRSRHSSLRCIMCLKQYGWRANGMSKGRDANKEVKKQPKMTPKERKAVKKAKKEAAKFRNR